MARFVDLEAEEDEADLAVQDAVARQLHKLAVNGEGVNGDNDLPPTTQPSVKTFERPSDFSSSVTRVFHCYPVVVGMVSLIDITTLDSLARTCRNIRAGLLQYRSILLSSTLHCSNEALPVDPDQVLRYRARAGIWEDTWEMSGQHGGKSGDCARDMVRPCRRCGTVVCRNCAIKPPSPASLPDRVRRLCKICARAPLTLLPLSKIHPDISIDSDMVKQAVCRCATDGVFLCQPCGKGIRAMDVEYKSIWRWRNHYGEVLGGLGTGIGDGDRGVICGRGTHCLAAKEREHEVDCDAEDAKHYSSSPAASSSSTSLIPTPGSGVHNHAAHGNGHNNHYFLNHHERYHHHHRNNSNHNHSNLAPSSHNSSNPLETLITESSSLYARTPSPQLGPGYERHEIEGIGGVVKTKLLRMVRVGACVPEWIDEQGAGNRSLKREVDGKVRSWCGWCWRVIPGPDDHL